MRGPYLNPGPCAALCVGGIAFANHRVGYLFGTPIAAPHSKTLFRTVDGGRRWQRMHGGAGPVAVTSKRVARLAPLDRCSMWCHYAVLTAALGARTWQRSVLPGSIGDTAIAQVDSSGSRLLVQAYGNPAGGADARSVLWLSDNRTTTWTNAGEPCPQRHVSGREPEREVDSVKLTAAPDGSVTIACVPRDSVHERGFLITTPSASAPFRRHGRLPVDRNGDGSYDITALSRHVLIALIYGSGNDPHERYSIVRSTDGGVRWTSTGIATVNPGAMRATSTTSAQLLGDNGRTLLATTDAGRTWRTTHLPR